MQLKKIIYHIVKPILSTRTIVRLKERDSYKCKLIKEPDNFYPCVAHVKEVTWEDVNTAEVFNVTRAHKLSLRMSPLDLYKVENAVVADDCDVVMTPIGALWGKCTAPMFSKEIIRDRGYYKHNDEYVYMRKGKQIHINGKCISLLGLYASEWAHFIVQYLPKLYFVAEQGLLDEPITVLIPNFKDKQLWQVLNEFKEKYPRITYYPCESSNEQLSYISCDYLYYMLDAAIITKHTAYVMPYDIIIPKVTRDILYRQLINPLIEKIKNRPVTHEKLYLVRRGVMRSMVNWQEVENYFVSQGFYPIEPHMLSIEEKVDLFYHSKVIVGPHSSAWTNLFFVEHAKALILSPIARTMDLYLSYLIEGKNIELLQVIDKDLSNSDIHTPYYIPIEKIKSAYNQLTRMNDNIS